MTGSFTLTDVRLVDAEACVVEETSISVADGIITGIGDRPRPGERVVSGRNAYAVPGLIDAHVHVFANPHPRNRFEESPAERSARVARGLAAALSAGITTVRDLGSPTGAILRLRDLVARGTLIGPRLVVAGAVIARTGGHGHWLGVTADTAEEVEGAVRAAAGHGVDVVKFTMGSHARPRGHDPEALGRGVGQALALGLPVAVHASIAGEDIDTAIAARPVSVEHGWGITDAQLSDLAATGAYLCPTISAALAVERCRDLAISIMGADSVDSMAATIPETLAGFRRAAARGVRVVAGTDAGAAGVGAASLVDELHEMVRLGWTPGQALAAATASASAVLDRPDLGRIVPGAAADLVLLRTNPLDSLAALRSPLAVLKDGARVVTAGEPPRRRLPGEKR